MGGRRPSRGRRGPGSLGHVGCWVNNVEPRLRLLAQDRPPWGDCDPGQALRVLGVWKGRLLVPVRPVPSTVNQFIQYTPAIPVCGR